MRRLVIEPPALKEMRGLLRWSRQVFGSEGARNYEKLMRRAYDLLRDDPARPNVQRREDLPRAPYTFHLRHARTRGAAPKQARHIIVFTYDDTSVTILRVLHDSMDIEHRVGNDDDQIKE
jgi:plasmid stabilization system protein ParE